MHKLWPQVLDQLAHRIGDGFDALEFEDFLVYPLDSSEVITLLSKCSDGSTAADAALR